jgi:NAD(P)-dependent dehydrogenase (short-subunit alcohol dehydrogenase family)
VYPAVDPAPAYAAQALAGKVALVTGASLGIGQAIVLSLARAGASLALVSRNAAALEKTKANVLSVAPRADVLVLAVDVRDTAAAETAVQAAVAHFGRLDLLVANAGATTPWTKRPYSPLRAWVLLMRRESVTHEKDPLAWWNVFEVNVKGVFNFVR